jgi:hypothetical protein
MHTMFFVVNCTEINSDMFQTLQDHHQVLYKSNIYIWFIYTFPVFRLVRKINFVMSVRTYSVPTGRIFMKFDNEEFFENL